MNPQQTQILIAMANIQIKKNAVLSRIKAIDVLNVQIEKDPLRSKKFASLIQPTIDQIKITEAEIVLLEAQLELL